MKMAKPIIMELADTGARREKLKLVKNIPYGMVFGDDKREGGNWGEVLGYILDPNADEHNPEGYNDNEREFANRWRQLYDRSKNDANIVVGLFALTKGENLKELALEERVTTYITDGPDSILKTQAVPKEGQEEKYNSIDLRIEDLSTGGYL